jgi:hypothetical protein
MKKLQMLSASLLAALCLTSLSTYAQCPLGQGETTLSIHRVMRNFGRFIMEADMISLKGVNPNETVKDSEIQTAIVKLGYVIDCAQAVLDHPTGEILPDEASKLSGDALKEYIDDFLYFMTDFRDEVTQYRELLKKILTLKPEERDFHPVRDKSKEIDELVEHAHKKV